MKPKLLVILGSTSTGKTDLGINIAKKLGGEIISADSRQVYKHLDIGTGKLPGEYETLKKSKDSWGIDGIKVWMYDVVNPDKRFNLYEYILKAEAIVRKISNSGKLPIIVGGTGLYIRSLLEGVSNFGSDENPDLRKELENLDIEQIKKRMNPKVLENLNNSELNNKRRLIRHAEISAAKKNGQSFKGLQENYDVIKIGLTADRKVIRERVKQRILKRLDQGMIQESKNLLAQKILTYEKMGELGLEYKYIANFLKGEIKTLEDLIEILNLKIGQFAKRQETWFKKEKDVTWFDITEKDFKPKVVKHILDWYNLDKVSKAGKVPKVSKGKDNR